MKGNKGRFQAGADPRRHVLTTEQRKRGYRAAVAKVKVSIDPVDGPAWILYKVKKFKGQL
jgi:hypothetical protein